MNRWEGKVALVTGASTGIGLDVAKTLFKRGMITVGVSRRKEIIENEMKNVKGKGKFYALKCDVSKEEDVLQVFQWIKKNLGTVHVVINNAGISFEGNIIDTNQAIWEQVIGVNILGVLYCCQQAIKMLKESGEEGHIININSVDGHRVVRTVGWESNIYCGTKFALTALTTTLELELIGSKIRMTSVSPGFTKTNSLIMDNKDAPTLSLVNNAPIMEQEDISEAIIYILGTHPRVQITELTIKPLGESF
ncbi:farnesol dehydrogenase-like [Leptopilina boulardi]|uniref:farnesol dehydrogenase-like n=1 Tax=Leptopilina boulardi TaxID=63433 RepID=UPI0021F66569|nr:farnesol dehydrogenase-like [Leptopilina boulardi]